MTRLGAVIIGLLLSLCLARGAHAQVRDSTPRAPAGAGAQPPVPAASVAPPTPPPTAPNAAAGAAGEDLFFKGRALASAGQYAEACPLFEQARKLHFTIGTILNLADCYERIGRTGSAWRWFHEAAVIAKAVSDPREAYALQRLALLEHGLLKLTLQTSAVKSLGDVEITLDDDPLPRDRWDSPIPVDLGTHRIAVQATGKQAWSTSVYVSGTMSLVIPSLEDAPPTAAEQPADHCTSDEDCSSKHCVAGHCEVPRKNDGQICTTNDDCFSRYCLNTYCQELKGAYGDACAADNQCLSDHCVSSTCVGRRLDGAKTCKRDDDCLSGRCLSGACAHACWRDTDCPGALPCFDQRWCSPLRPEDSPCRSDEECGTGSCVRGRCAASDQAGRLAPGGGCAGCSIHPESRPPVALLGVAFALAVATSRRWARR